MAPLRLVAVLFHDLRHMMWRTGTGATASLPAPSARLAPQPLTKGAEMALYEHIFIVRPDVSPAQMETLLEETKTLIESQGGKTGKVEYWGLRNLSYRINKSRKGHYGLIDIDASGPVIDELERLQRLSEDVMRYMTVRVDEHTDQPSAILSKKDDRRPRRDFRS
jgi:small subunit ribosomal protein S6